MALNRRRKPAGAVPPAVEELQPPGPLQLMLEARAPWECAAMLAAMPWLRQLPVGDGHPVIVFPGLGATDFTTAPLRGFLSDRGYTAYPWKQGFNFGPRHGVLDALRDQVRHVADRHREKVSLIGWSLGGVYAREMAKEMPDKARCVITLGAPFSGHPRATNAWRFYQMVSGQNVEQDPEFIAQLRVPPPVPTTSIYSKTDGVVAWQCSLNDGEPHTENIEVHASHIGMGMNPLALYVIADRLMQDPARWQRFDLRGARRWFYKTTDHSPLQAASQG
ncbi:esterase/lipase family protein [Aquabacterium sp.]|uniref:esterase/lipase family protein n=1 Tax=Aquabacterium sp. TaxID=1872578 RepID=UPI002CCDE144|nr:alpha/beta hydrolase [Aquabacterium sp.]HSW09186.1 alpha/beta hydrolase [Aquabacterium sp.]